MSDAEPKYKGVKGASPRQGLGRLRRANAKDAVRRGGWEHHHDDDDYLDRHGAKSRPSHGGESLLAKFNHLARAAADQAGEAGEICAFSGRAVVVRAADGSEHDCEVRQVLKKMIAGVKNPLCVGDRVNFDRAGGVIVAVAPRRNQLERTDSHNRSLIQVFAANLDRLVIVAALAEPDLKLGLIDRYLVIAAANGIAATVVLNKADLGDPTGPAALYRGLGVPLFTVIANRALGNIPPLREHLRGKTCVVAGQSGVGKSSLINALYPEFAARVGAMANAGYGRHTTTAGRSYPLPDGGRLIDTPGIRECAIAGLGPTDVGLLYPDLAALHARCRFADCTHLHEPDCAVLAAVQRGELAASRYASYCSIVTEDLA
jgi:ribosome biogenesis GTPase